ncbi:Maltodextrin phosphorylase [Suttonella ornithocola]|uniref:Alpha-1,4 glucan phosphorylase n=1 Tax=Suttonella ornithocola TaxID=279832 RepID=A0A380MX50_9GAMM|nr:Maltodextrin phosphorylase [Suttonella ornithocola]
MGFVINGEQVEQPDLWLEKDMAWQFVRPSKRYPIRYGGTLRRFKENIEWQPAEEISVLGYDDIIPGFGRQTSNTLRLWTAHAGQQFDLADFNKGDYFAAMAEKPIKKMFLVFFIQMTQRCQVKNYVYARNTF